MDAEVRHLNRQPEPLRLRRVQRKIHTTILQQAIPPAEEQRTRKRTPTSTGLAGTRARHLTRRVSYPTADADRSLSRGRAGGGPSRAGSGHSQISRVCALRRSRRLGVRPVWAMPARSLGRQLRRLVQVVTYGTVPWEFATSLTRNWPRPSCSPPRHRRQRPSDQPLRPPGQGPGLGIIRALVSRVYWAMTGVMARRLAGASMRSRRAAWP